MSAEVPEVTLHCFHCGKAHTFRGPQAIRFRELQAQYPDGEFLGPECLHLSTLLGATPATKSGRPKVGQA